MKLDPLPESGRIRNKLTETTEAVSVIMRKGALPLGEYGDVTKYAVFAEKGGVLTMSNLLEIAKHLKIVRTSVAFLKSDVSDITMLEDIISVMESDKTLEERIEISIISETEMADAASTELKRIRRQINLQNENIRAHLNKLITSSSVKDMLQDQLVTLRDGRYVVPVKQEYRQKFPGLVHDQSKGGATVFIEPQAVVDSNNKLRELEFEEAKEIERILTEISAEVALLSNAIKVNQDMLVKLDLIFAKGKLSCDLDAVEPEINDLSRLEIVNGRNPFIEKDKVVPVSLSLGYDYRILVITGPNTGGKTVTLKTVGLFVLMAMAGLHIPADKANIPVRAYVNADIGDEQSIEQSLSTFSSHMKKIDKCIRGADSRGIVFLDELGAGTDPAEGAALAIAILELLAENKAMVIATTHYTELKKYAMTTEGVENASMEFDVETLSPTYRLRMGMPGKSNAFEISRKLGIYESVVRRATELMDSGTLAFENAIESVEEDRQKAESDKLEAEVIKREMQEQKLALEKEIDDFDNKKEKLLEKAKSQASQMIEEAEEYADIIRDELKAILDDAQDFADNGRITDEGEDVSRGDFYRKLDENRKLLRQLDSDYNKADKKKERRDDSQKKKLNVTDIKIGDRVRLDDLDQKGDVITLPDEKGDVGVQVGRMKMTINISKMSKIEENTPKAKNNAAGIPKSKGYSGLIRNKMNSISTSIDVHGKNLDDAEVLLDKYLDDAFLAGLGEITVIHGRGEGILRTGLRKMLKAHKHVKSVRSGNHTEGGDGATIVTLK